MYLNRLIDKELLCWKNDKEHKPILLRGARQVGKSSSVRKLAKEFVFFIAEQFAGLELLESSSCFMPMDLYFWTRDNSQSRAEVDYVIQQNEKIIPIEVKAGTSGKMQSMHLFFREKNSEYGIRTSLENFTKYDNIRVYPLYAIGNIKLAK